MTILRPLFKVAIAVFCLWHMAAIGIYSLVNVQDIPVLSWLDRHRDIVSPYVLSTSQWQRWNLFSPDPLRRVIALDIQRMNNGQWHTYKTVDEHHVGWWQRAPELKIIRRMEDENMQPLQTQYLTDICRREFLPRGTRLRMVKRWFIIPKNDTTQTGTWWHAWEPEWFDMQMTETVCPSPPTA